jgi:DNA-binding NarL/FixJ family response regulator
MSEDMQASSGIQATPASAGRVRVMLVDDHPVLRAGVATLLRAAPDLVVVGEAADGARAVQMAKELSPDVVVMDVSLPELGGAEATKQILAADPAPRVLVLSVHEETGLVQSLLDAGASGYLLKRSAGEELVRAIRAIAVRQRYIDPALSGMNLVPRNSAPKPPGRTRVSLSQREAEVIRLLALGHTSKEIAGALGLSPRTLETYRQRAMSKLHLQTRAELIRYAACSGWLRDS